MSTLVVAKKEFKDGIRSRALLALVALFVVATIYEVYSVSANPGLTIQNPNAHRTAIAAIDAMNNPVFILFVGMLVGYNAISGERASGSFKLLLGLPHTRRAVMAGKFLGRAALLVVAMLVGFATGGVLVALLTGTLPVGEYTVAVVMSILLGTVFISIATAVSSAIRTQALATRAAVGVTIVFYAWGALMYVLSFFVSSGSLWYRVIEEFDPTKAYNTSILLLRDNLVHPGRSSQFPLVDASGPHLQPFVLQNWFAFVILAFWLVVPAGLAYVRFQRMDFG